MLDSETYQWNTIDTPNMINDTSRYMVATVDWLQGPDRHSKTCYLIGSSTWMGSGSTSGAGYTALAAPKARVQAPTVSEDEDSADLIVPDGEGGASVGVK